jgi:DNA-binding IscR family transcriptional regulator
MLISASATHALRAVAWLAAHGDGRAVLGRDLARQVGVPADYLAKVLGQLARTGVLSATRGAKGGYRLARPGCLLRPDRPCRDSAPCSAHARWTGVKRSYTEFLDRTSVADIQGGE